MLKYKKQSIGYYSHGTKHYEMSDEQREQIKDLFPKSQTNRPPTDNRLMLNVLFGLQEAVLHGVIYLNASVIGKQYTVVFVNGVMMTRCLTYSIL